MRSEEFDGVAGFVAAVPPLCCEESAARAAGFDGIFFPRSDLPDYSQFPSILYSLRLLTICRSFNGNSTCTCLPEGPIFITSLDVGDLPRLRGRSLLEGREHIMQVEIVDELESKEGQNGDGDRPAMVQVYIGEEKDASARRLVEFESDDQKL